MRWFKRGPVLFGIAFVFAQGLPAAQIELLGEVVVPRDPVGHAAPVGGLSGLSYNRERDIYFAISDDAGRMGPPRIYQLRIDLSEGRLKPEGVEVEKAILLRRADGSHFPRLGIDPESLASTPEGNWIVASEGHVDSGVPAALLEFGPDGSWMGPLPLPSAFVPAPQAGVRHNLALESATISPDGRWLFTGLENALVQDGPEASVAQGSSSRLLRIDLATRRVKATYRYRTEPIASPPVESEFAVNGLVDLLALDDHRLLALERSFTVGQGNVVRLFLVELKGKARRWWRRKSEVSKRLLLDVGSLGVTPDNLEGMIFGPDLADGRATLVLVADDNFNPGVQQSQLIALAFDRALLEPQ